MKNIIVKALAENLSEHLTPDAVEKVIEIPPSDDLGDYAFPCFSLSKILKKNPAAIATELKDKVMDSGEFGKNGINVVCTGGYLNFFVDKKTLAQNTLAASLCNDYGRGGAAKKRVVIEFASPNTNKPLHLGHLRNMAIGDSVARILEFGGCEVVRTSINNDRGVHICKSMLAYLRKGNNTSPAQLKIKSDHFIGYYYVMFNNESAKDPSWNDDAQKMLKSWEDGDQSVIELWKTMNGWALDGFHDTYKLFGISFDKEYYESDIYKFGKEIVNEGLERGIFQKREDGAVFVDLTDEKLDTKVLLRPDGTSVYIVQDLYLALLKDKEYKYDRSIYVVGNEQDYHFAVLIAIFKKLGYDVADKMKHLSYGMVELPEGKMKSREGTVVDADDLITETANLAKQEIHARQGVTLHVSEEGDKSSSLSEMETGISEAHGHAHTFDRKLSDAEMDDRALKIALAAIKYQLLKIDIAKNMIFDPKKSISFEGDTGPYLLYSYARASSIMRKAIMTGIVKGCKYDGNGNSDRDCRDCRDADMINIAQITAMPDPAPAETKLIKKIAFFTEALRFAQDRLSPSVIANYAFELAQTFNEFYHAHQVIGSGDDVEGFRVNMVAAFRNVIGKCLELLGIETIEEM